MEPQTSAIVESPFTLIDILPDWPNISSSHALDGTELSFALVKITPELASQILQTQKVNRKLSLPRVLEYSRRQEQKEWAISDALKFDEEGHLIDGQHRAAAVARSGEAQLFPIILGYPKHSQSVLDIGMNRTVAQIGQLEGLNITGMHVSVARALYLVGPNSRALDSMMSSPQKVLGTIKTHREAIDFSIKTFGSKPFKHASVRAIVARAWYHENRKRLEEFLNVFDTGFATSLDDSAAVVLRNFVIDLKSRKADAGGQSRQILAFKSVSAVEAFLAREERKQLKPRSSCKWKISGIDA